MGERDYTASLETARRHALEKSLKYLQTVHMLEKKMGVRERWNPGGLEWKAAAKRVVMRRYQRCIDVLEGLVVARMFELTKMNMSQTGMCSHLVIGGILNSKKQQATVFGNTSQML